ncbi:type VII secretion protein EccCa [Georgenia alba]|uniref:Type VII secretion protein EccCa n=1 Tax=Georgenia alba TaxID=2233858 RepID=A0ABW2Q3C4_9MICO
MTVKLVHRPTRHTVPLERPQPETVSPPPPVDEDQARTPMQYMMPMIGALTSVTMMVVMRNGNPLFLMIAALVFVAAIVGGLGMALSQRGRAARQARMQRELYLDYLETARRDLRERAATARNAAATLDPEPAALMSLVRDPSRLWERRKKDSDYLRVRFGRGSVPWFALSVPPPESPLKPHDPSLLHEVSIVTSAYSSVPAMPVPVELRGAHVVAVVGARDEAVAAARSMLLQLATHHSPDDVVIAATFSPDQAADWQGVDLLPHAQDPELFDGPVPARRVAPDMESLARVLGEELAARSQHATSTRRSGARRSDPARLVILVDDHGRRASTLPVSATLAELGITVIHVLADRMDEPDNVDVRLNVGDGVVTTQAGTPEAVDVELEADQASATLFAATARAMSAMRLSLTTGAREDEEGTPVLDLTELLGVEDPATIDPDELWRPRSPAEFLRVPFGSDDRGSPVFLDLKESAQLGMGPHGICIGATGSGKSEMLRTLILSLAMSHGPEDLSMILVDYKGGAAFAPFAPLPHLAGLIDNLADDPQLTTRARASIQGEVVRRQQLLKSADSSPSITHYRALREERPDLPPMPHLFVVIDEFGELLTAEPEFIDLFLQIGRIGRSIGVHLLLSSQRIESGKLRGLDTYLSYRLGLRTFSEAESQTVLSTPDAYHLPALPGYGYLKVDTSVYSRFRAGYVSGPVNRQRRPQQVDSTPRPLALPVFNGISRDSAAGASGQESSAPQLARPETERTFVDEAVERLRDDEIAVRPVWLPPLPERVALGGLLEERNTEGLKIVLGLEDDPAKQSQAPWVLDLTRAGGHVAIVGAPQTGRSTLLRTVAASLALTYTPQHVAIYGMDLTGGGLQRIEPFPHVGGVAARSSRDRLLRLLEELAGMLALRERIFKKYAVDSMTELRTMHAAGKVPELNAPDVVLLVDGYGALRQDFEELEDAFVDIMLRASSFGLHLVMAMNRWGDLRIAHQSLFGTRVELRMNDPGDSQIDRKLSGNLSADTPGRALLDNKHLGHVALPVLDLVPDDEVGDELEDLAKRTAEAWNGPSAAPIRLLPHHFTRDELPDAFDEPDVVPFGIRQDTMDTAWWDFSGEDQHLVVLGDAKCGKSTLLRTIAVGLQERFTEEELAIAVVDIRGHVPGVVEDKYLAAHARNAGQAAGLANSIAQELQQRAERSKEEQAKSPRIVVLIDDFDLVSAGGADPFHALLPHLVAARDLKLHVVVSRPVAGASRGFYVPFMQTTRETGGSLLLMSGERSEGMIAPRIYPERFPPGRGRFLRRGENPHIVQVATTPEVEIA